MSGLYPSRWRQDPQPLGRGGEIALVALTALLLALGLAALAGLGVAAALFGGGWVWPHSAQTSTRVLSGLIAGHPGRALPPRLAHRVPGRGAVYGCVAASELICIAVLITAAALVGRYRQPGDARGGMATRAQATRILGRSRVRAAAAIIRPDLHPDRHPRPVHSRGGGGS